MRKAAAMHLRAIKELHSVTPRFFPVLTLYCLFGAITPYVTVFFSARILTELAMLRRAEILWRWVLAGVLCVGLAAIGKALLYRRYNTLLEDLYGRKDMLFVNKMFRLDYSELDKQENHDLREQIKQNENWSGWGLMRVHEIYSGVVTGILGLFSGAALTVSLFTAPVPSSAGWLIELNNPIFVLVLAFGILIISVLAGRLSAGAVQCWGDFSEEATFGNRMFGHFGFIGQDKRRAIDIRMNDQQRLIRAYWSGDSVFGIHGAFAKLARGKMGLYASLGVSITTLTTGMIYLFTCLKALGGAFDVGSCTQYIGAATAMVANVFALTDMIGVLKANAGFGERLATLEKGLDTMLYKNLSDDGVEVSGGEAQKIAIARALYKDAPFIILDEPTAALDPIAEAEIYSKFDEIAGDKTAIYISHRLSSCKFCDEIAVFHEGEIIQQGSHDELLADRGGKYYALWNAQAQYYTE